MTQTDRQLTLTIAAFFRRQQAQALAALKAGVPFPHFAGDAEAMQAVATPLITPLFLRGARRTARELGRKVRPGIRPAVKFQPLPFKWLGGTEQAKASRHVIEATNTAVLKSVPSFAAWLFRQLFPKVAEAVQRLTLAFCQDTLDTTRHDLDKARRLFRAELNEGLEEGEATANLTARVRKVFDTPRAYSIARTEGNRAVSSGGQLAAKESGVVEGKTWLASREACEKCLALNGKTVPLDEPFVVLTTGNPAYRVVMHAPYHTNCTCDNTFAVMEKYR